MKIALYTGDHSGDSWTSRAGYYIINLMQKGPYSGITHVEAILFEYPDGTVTMASSSAMDGGVRQKTLRLNPLNWRIVDIPQWDVAKSIDYLEKTRGRKYDWRGAIATVFIGSDNKLKEFCNEWVGEPHLFAAETFTPSQFAAISLSIGKEITTEFFRSRE